MADQGVIQDKNKTSLDSVWDEISTVQNKTSLDSVWDEIPDGSIKTVPTTPTEYPDVMSGQDLDVQKQDVMKPGYMANGRWGIFDYSQSNEAPVASTPLETLSSFSGEMGRSLAPLFHGLDYMQTQIGDYLKQNLFGKSIATAITVAKDKGIPDVSHPFKLLYDAMVYAANGPQMPEGILGDIAKGTAAAVPQVLAAWAAPELTAAPLLEKWGLNILAKSGFGKLSKFGAVMGGQAMIESIDENKNSSVIQKVTVPVIKGLEQYITGVFYDMGGLVSSRVGSRVAEKVFPEYTKGIVEGATKAERIDSPFSHPDIKLTESQQVNKMLVHSLNTTAFNANIIGGYGSLVEYLTTGDTSWKTYFTGVGTGLALSMHEVGKLVKAKMDASLIAATPEMIQNTINSPMSSEEAFIYARDKFNSIDISKNPEGAAAEGLLAAKYGMLRAAIEEIQVNPTDMMKSIEESITMPQEMKDYVIEQIQQIYADSDPGTVAARSITKQIEAIDKEIEMIKTNSNLTSVDQELKTKSLAAKREGMVNKVIKLYDEAKVKTGDKRNIENLRQARIMEVKAASVFPQFNDQITAIANKYNGDVESRLKAPESTANKAVEVSDVEDVIGGRIIVPSMKDFKAVAKDIKITFPDAKFSNKRKANSITGERGAIAKVNINGVNAEIQLHTPETLKAQKAAEVIRDKYRKEGIPPPDFVDYETDITKYKPEDQLKVHEESVKEGGGEGGSTFSSGGENLIGVEGKSSVSVFPDLTTKIEGRDITSEDLTAFRDKPEVKKLLEEYPEDFGIGTWKDKDGTTWIDVATIVPTAKAKELGKTFNQVSVFDLKNKTLIETGGTGENLDPKTGKPFDISIEDRVIDIRNTPRAQYEAAMEESRRLYDEAYKGFEYVALEGSPATTPAKKKAKELGIPIAQQKELNKAWTETKNMLVGELKGKNEDIKTKFKDFIETLPSLPGLDIKLRVGMLKKVNAIDFTKPASLGRAIDYFDKIVNNATFRLQVREAEQALNILDTKSSEASMTKHVANNPDKNIKGPTGLPLWDEIKAVRSDMINKDWGKGQEEIDNIFKKMDEEGRLIPTVEEMDQVNRYGFWGLLNSTNKADSRELRGKARDLMDTRKRGSSNAVAEQMIKQAQIKETAGLQLDALSGNGRKVLESDVRKVQNKKESFLKYMEGALFDWPMSSSLFSHIEFLSQNDRTSKPYAGILHESLGEPLWYANRQTYIDRKQLFNEINTKAAEIFNVTEGKKLKKNAKDRTKTIYTVKYKDVAGKDQTLDLTMNQAIKIYMELQDPSLEASHEAGYYKRNGELTSLGQGVMDLLTPEAKAWGDWQLNEFYPKLYEFLNPTYRRLYGRDMPYTDMFSPIFIEGADQKAVSNDDLLSRQSFVSGLKNGSLLSRVKHAKPLRLMDVDQVAMSYVHNMTYWKNYTEPIQNLNTFISDPVIRSAIKQLFTNADQHINVLQKDVADLLRRPTDAWQTAGVLRKIRNNFLISSLAIKVPVGIQQLSSALAYTEYIPMKEIPKYAIENLWHWMGDKGNVALAKKLWNDAYMEQRTGQGWDNVLTEIMATDYHNVGNKSTWRSKTMFPILAGDVSSIFLGGIPVYRYTYDQALKKYGKGGERLAEAEALHVFTRATDDTQQSGLHFNLSQIQTSNDFLKSMTMYKSAPMQYHRKVSAGVRNLVSGRGTWQQNVKTIALYHVVLPAVFQWMANGFRWDTKDEIQAGVLGNVNNLFALGDIVEGIINVYRGEPWKKYNISPILSTVDDIVSATQHIPKVYTSDKKMIKGIPEEYIPQVLEAAKDYKWNFLELEKAIKYTSKVLGAAAGLPVPGVTSMGKGIYDVASGVDADKPFMYKLQHILGKSDYTLQDAADDSDLTPEEIEEMTLEYRKNNEKAIPGPVKIPEKKAGKGKTIPNF